MRIVTSNFGHFGQVSYGGLLLLSIAPRQVRMQPSSRGELMVVRPSSGNNKEIFNRPGH